jgi:hypothetical protein
VCLMVALLFDLRLSLRTRILYSNLTKVIFSVFKNVYLEGFSNDVLVSQEPSSKFDAASLDSQTCKPENYCWKSQTGSEENEI